MSTISNYFDVQGQGPLMVFIHGSYATHATWKKLIAELQQNFTCIAVKLPGHAGLADPEDFAAPTIATEAGIVQQVIAEVAGDSQVPVHLVGHSFGAVAALALAATGAVQTLSLTLFEPVAGNIFPLVKDDSAAVQIEVFLQRYRAAVAYDEPDACGYLIDFWGGEGSYAGLPAHVKEGMRPLVQNNMRHWELCLQPLYTLEQLKHYEPRVSIVCGSRSNAVAKKIAHHLDANFANSAVHIVEQASHFMVSTHPNDCIRLIQENVGIWHGGA